LPAGEWEGNVRHRGLPSRGFLSPLFRQVTGGRMATLDSFSKDFPLDTGIFTTAKLTLGASTTPTQHRPSSPTISSRMGTSNSATFRSRPIPARFSVKPATVGGALVSFDITPSAQSGMGVYGTSADAIKAINLADAPCLRIADADRERYSLLMVRRRHWRANGGIC